MSQAAATVRYDDDLCAWAEQQAARLRAGRLNEIDIEHLADEITDLRKTEYWRLWSALRVLVMPMLKWDQQPEMRTPSSAHSIKEQRRRYGKLIKTSPSLKERRDDALVSVSAVSRSWASDETSIPEDEFPAECPYTWDDLLDRPFEVDEAARRPR